MSFRSTRLLFLISACLAGTTLCPVVARAETVVTSGDPAAQAGALVFKSPDGKVTASVFRDASGAPAYAVTREGKTVAGTSAFGLLAGAGELAKDVVAIAVEKTYATDESYARNGAHATARDHANGAVILVKRAKGDDYRIEVRVADDGFAFRYLLSPEAGPVKADRSEFVFPKDSVLWAVTGGEEGTCKTGKLGPDAKSAPSPAVLPLTVKTPEGLYVVLLESNRGEFPGFRQARYLGDGRFTAEIAGEYAAPAGAPVVTPWRVLLATPSLDRLVNSDFQDTLADKPDPKLFPQGIATPWIKPGRVSWSWMRGDGQKGISLKTQKEWVDSGAKLGYEYLLVDEGWGHWNDKGEVSCGNFYKCAEKHSDETPWKPMKELIAYAKTRGMKVWLWHAYDERFNISGIKSPEARLAFFKRCQEAGVVGLKIDFFPAPTQEVLRWQTEALRDAAKTHLMISFHGCGVPAGEARTYPNEMTREGLRGLEYGGGGSYVFDTVCLPFNRMLAGHGDFTPVDPGAGGATTAAHFANAALINSPAMHYVESPANLAAMGKGVSQLVATIPLTWDETRVLPPSEIGEVAVFARRKGASWWLAVINGKQTRTITVPPDFLGAGSYTVSEIRDKEGKDVRAYDFKRGKRNAGDRSPVTLELKSGGGYLARFDP